MNADKQKTGADLPPKGKMLSTVQASRAGVADVLGEEKPIPVDSSEREGAFGKAKEKYIVSRLKEVDSLVTKKKYDEAIRSAKALIGQFPNNPDIYSALSDIYVQMKRWEEAIAAKKEAMKLKPNDTRLKMELASLERTRNRAA